MELRFSGKYKNPDTEQSYTYEATCSYNGRELHWSAKVHLDSGDFKGTPNGYLPMPASTPDVHKAWVTAEVEKSIYSHIGVDF